MAAIHSIDVNTFKQGTNHIEAKVRNCVNGTTTVYNPFSQLPYGGSANALWLKYGIANTTLLFEGGVNVTGYPGKLCGSSDPATAIKQISKLPNILVAEQDIPTIYIPQLELEDLKTQWENAWNTVKSVSNIVSIKADMQIASTQGIGRISFSIITPSGTTRVLTVGAPGENGVSVATYESNLLTVFFPSQITSFSTASVDHIPPYTTDSVDADKRYCTLLGIVTDIGNSRFSTLGLTIARGETSVSTTKIEAVSSPYVMTVDTKENSVGPTNMGLVYTNSAVDEMAFSTTGKSILINGMPASTELNKYISY